MPTLVSTIPTRFPLQMLNGGCYSASATYVAINPAYLPFVVHPVERNCPKWVVLRTMLSSTVSSMSTITRSLCALGSSHMLCVLDADANAVNVNLIVALLYGPEPASSISR